MNALQLLRELDYTIRVQKYKSVPAHCIAPSKFSDKTANALTKCILRWLELHSHKAWRQGSEGRYRPGKQFTDVIGRVRQMKGQWLPGSNKGHADINAIINGKFAAIEVKVGRDKQSLAQKLYQQEVESSGGVYYVARDFEQFMQWYLKLETI